MDIVYLIASPSRKSRSRTLLAHKDGAHLACNKKDNNQTKAKRESFEYLTITDRSQQSIHPVY